MNPVIAVTVGNVNAALHVLVGAAIVGAAGNITTFTVLLAAHAAGAEVPAGILPHAALVT